MYVVTMTHSFDPEYKAVLFGAESNAKAYLHMAWEDYINTEFVETEGNVDIERSFHEEDYGCIYWNDSGDVTEFRLMETEWGSSALTFRKMLPYLNMYKESEEE